MTGWNELGVGEIVPEVEPEMTTDEIEAVTELMDADGDGVPNSQDNCNTRRNPGETVSSVLATGAVVASTTRSAASENGRPSSETPATPRT